LSPDAIMFLKMLLVLGLVLGFGFWELWKLKRDKKK
jgi:flagellar biogenesis protein FliO